MSKFDELRAKADELAKKAKPKAEELREKSAPMAERLKAKAQQAGQSIKSTTEHVRDNFKEGHAKPDGEASPSAPPAGDAPEQQP